MTAKSTRKSETVAFTSPWGTARFPHINAPDIGGQMSDGKFKTGLLLDDAGAAVVDSALKAAAKQLWPNEKYADLNTPLKEMKDKDRDTGKKHVIGKGINAKSQRQPAVFDAEKNKIPKHVKIGGGSELRIGGAIAPYARTINETVIENGVKSRVEGVEKGLTIYLNSVHVRKLCAGGGGVSDGSEFEAVEGYKYDNSADETATDDATNF